MRNSTSLAVTSLHSPKPVKLRVVSGVGARSSPCEGCEKRQICREPCEELERLLEPVKTRGREVLSPRAVEFRGQTIWDPAESEERERWDDLRKRYLPHLRLAVRMLRGKERIMMEQQLEKSTVTRRVSKRTKVQHDARLDVAMAKVAANLEVLQAPGKCMEPGCSAPVKAHRFVKKELRGYCEVHRQLRSFSLSTAVTPDRVRAAKLFRAQQQVGCLDVSPGLALALLELNRKNRRLHQDRVEMFAQDMRNGDWHLNNQGIGLGRDRTLYDGQHRLWAVVKSGCTVPMSFTAGLSEQARPTIDQGRPRTFGNVLQMFDGQPNGARIASWLRAINTLQTKRHAPMSHSVLRREFARYEGSVDWFLLNEPKASYRKSAVIGALVYAHAVASEQVEGFARRYMTGVNLAEGSPVLALRNYVTEHGHRGPDSSRAVSLKTLKCVLAEMRGEQLSRLFPTEEGYEHFRKLHTLLASGAARDDEAA